MKTSARKVDRSKHLLHRRCVSKLHNSPHLTLLLQFQLAFIAPDTSPRGANVPGEDDGWDFGTGAGFYLDATAEPWSRNYRMYSYVTKELPAVLAEHFTALDLNK